jgi:hypothetical protein
MKDLESKINLGMNFVVLMSSLPVNMQVRDNEWDSDHSGEEVCLLCARQACWHSLP